jgi:hypothetical protein
MSHAAPVEREQAHGAIQSRKSVSICASHQAQRWRDARDVWNGIGPGWPRGRRAASRHLENSRQQGPLRRRLGRHSSKQASCSALTTATTGLGPSSETIGRFVTVAARTGLFPLVLSGPQMRRRRRPMPDRAQCHVLQRQPSPHRQGNSDRSGTSSRPTPPKRQKSLRHHRSTRASSLLELHQAASSAARQQATW